MDDTGSGMDQTPGQEAAEGGPVTLNLLSTFPLSYFRELDEPLRPEERYLLAEQALLLIDNLYAHLPLKQAFLASEPSQALRLIIHRIRSYTDDRLFFRDLLGVFIQLRDLHTLIQMPAPWSQFTAFLPFVAAEYFDGGRPRYLIGEIHPLFLRGTFVPGVELIHWNGVPIDRSVEVLGESTSGANPPARRARAVASLTLRPLAFMLPPDEDWVDVTYLYQGQVQEIRLPWQVFYVPPPAAASGAGMADVASVSTLGVDPLVSSIKLAREHLFQPEIRRRERTLARSLRGLGEGDAPGQAPTATWLPRQLEARPLQTANGTFGYLRIKSFEVEDINLFLQEVRRLLALLPQNGVILDVRGNPGGMIPAGEGMLQFFTDRQIVPSGLQFRNTNLTLALAESQDFLAAWRRSIEMSIETGQVFSQALPLVPAEQVNAIGRVYPGKTVLLTDALCYSTTDFFAAGYQDHKIGPVIGTDATTGAGGANVWTHELLQSLWSGMPENPFKPLPRGASFRVALRRSVRVGGNADLPVEGVGVVPDILHRLSYRDIVEQDRDLLDFAAKILAGS